MPITPAAALNKIFEARQPDARVRKARTLSNLINMGRVRTTRKTNIDWPVRFSGETSKREPVTADVTTDQQSDSAPANLRIGLHRVSHTFDISKIAIAEAQEAAPEDIADLFGETLDDALNVLFRDINQLIWNGTGTAGDAGVTGLLRVLDNTQIYAGIDPTVKTEWKAITLTNGTARALTRKLMLDMDEQLDLFEEDYDMVFMNPSQRTKYVELFDTLAGANGIWNNPDATLPNADLGHSDSTFNGRTIVSDPRVPAGDIVLLDTSAVDIYVFDAAVNDPDSPALGSEVINTSYGLPFRIVEIAGRNPDSRTFNIRSHVQLKVGNRKRVKAIRNLL